MEQNRTERKGEKTKRLHIDLPFKFEFLFRVATSGLDVFAHNIETVERLTPFVRDPRAKYRQTLKVLQSVKTMKPELVTKSSIMLGLGMYGNNFV